MHDWRETSAVQVSSTAICAGASAAISKSLMYPFDTLKLRIQILNLGGTLSEGSELGKGSELKHCGELKSGLSSRVSSTTRLRSEQTLSHSRSTLEGLRRSFSWSLTRVYAGLLPKLVLYVPYQSLYMSSYVSAKKLLSPSKEQMYLFPLCGALAELSSSIVRLPMEVIKQRMQSGEIKNSIAAVKYALTHPTKVYSFKLFAAQTLCSDIPFGCVNWSVYEIASEHYSYIPVTYRGFLAGFTACVLTQPLDTVKTNAVVKNISFPDSFRSLTADSPSPYGALCRLYRGWWARVLHVAPTTAIYMTIFTYLYSHTSG